MSLNRLDRRPANQVLSQLAGLTASRKNMPTQHRGLVCQVNDLQYNFDTRTGILRMPKGNCCHAPECIAIFERIDPNVKEIKTFAGDKPDTSYVKSSDGWQVFLPVRAH
jgi:hypothetical protein